MYWFRHHRRSLMRLTLTARGALLRRECGKSVRGAGLCGPGNEPGFGPAAAAGGTAMISSLLPSWLSAIPHRRGAYLIVAARLLGLRQFGKP